MVNIKPKPRIHELGQHKRGLVDAWGVVLQLVRDGLGELANGCGRRRALGADHEANLARRVRRYGRIAVLRVLKELVAKLLHPDNQIGMQPNALALRAHDPARLERCANERAYVCGWVGCGGALEAGSNVQHV